VVASLDNADLLHNGYWKVTITMAETVMVACSRFYSTPGVGLNQIRIAYIVEEET
jgi:hypothetical protein